MLYVLDLFSGIGGFSLGLEATGGFKTAAFCEIDPYCRAVLAKHWPHVPIYKDIRKLDYMRWPTPDHQDVDVICGGFPCQDISFAGKGAGIDGARSGLWGEYARLIGELRPSYAIVENVSALLVRGLGRVLGDLAALGYDAEWHCIPASAVGAPHRRDRIWIVAYPASADAWRNSEQSEGQKSADRQSPQLLPDAGGCGIADQSADVAHTHQPRLQGRLGSILRECAGERIAWTSGASGSDTEAMQRQAQQRGEQDGDHGSVAGVANADGESPGWSTESRSQRSQWGIEPDVGRVAHGIPSRVDRLRCLGNAVVPQITKAIGEAILEAEGE